jgi:hypothetical protein
MSSAFAVGCGLWAVSKSKLILEAAVAPVVSSSEFPRGNLQRDRSRARSLDLNSNRPMPHHHRRHFCLAALGATLPSLAWAGFNFWNSEYTASRAELQAMIATQFPRSQRYAEIFTVALSDPQLGLNAETNRAAITARVAIASPLLRGGQVDGTVALSSALRYDSAARALRLEQPKAERLELQGLSGGDAERLRQIGGVVAQELLQGQVLRTFTAEELSFGNKTYEIGDITVLADGIKVQLK